MPYIDETSKNKFNINLTFEDILKNVSSSGELNYLFTVISHNYIKNKGLRYQHINDVIGALHGASAEFNRRVTSNYEDACVVRNGDVFLIDDK